MYDSLVIVPQGRIVFLLVYLLKSGFGEGRKLCTGAGVLHLDDGGTGIALILDNDIGPAASAFTVRRDRVARPDKDACQHGVLEVFFVVMVTDGIQQDA